MPNIELYGFGFEQESLRIKKQIKDIFKAWPDMVITVVQSVVNDMQNARQPFVRVLDSNAERGERIALRIAMEGFDAEFQKLSKFLPRWLYTLEEIEEELHLIYGNSFDSDAVRKLKNWDFDHSRVLLADYIERNMRNMVGDQQLTQDELSQKHACPKASDQSPEANRVRFIRQAQMFNILNRQ